MPEIPLYQRSVMPTEQVTGAMISPEAAAAPYEAISKIGGLVKDIGIDYAKRRAELKFKSDMADYRTRLKEFETNYSEARQAAMLQKGVRYDEVYDRVLTPMLDTLRSDISEYGYSDQARAEIEQRWEYDRQIFEQKEINETLKLQEQDMINKLDQEAQLYISSDDPEVQAAGYKMYDELAGIVGDARVEEMKSTAKLGSLRVQMSAAEREFLTNGDPVAYINKLESIDSEGLIGNQKQSVELERSAKINNAIKTSNREAERAIKSFMDNYSAGTWSVADIEEMRKYVGSNYADSVAIATSNKSINKLVSDRDAKEGMKKLLEFRNGKISLPELLRDANKTGGQIGVMMHLVAADMMRDLANDQSDISAFEVMYKDRAIKVPDSNTALYVDRVAQYIELMPDNAEEYANGKFKALYEYQKNPGEKSFDEFMAEQLGEDARKIIETINLPSIDGTNDPLGIL